MVNARNKNHTRAGTVVVRAYIYRDKTRRLGVRITDIDEGHKDFIESIPIAIGPEELNGTP